MVTGPKRIILIDPSHASREVLVRRLTAQGYTVDAAPDPATGADMALSAPPAAIIAELWMPGISGVQLCRLLRAEPATADVPIILRGDADDPRSRFWAERAGATAYVRKGRMGELVRTLGKAVEAAANNDVFFMQLSGGHLDIRDRIARHLDAALFDSVIAAEVRALSTCGSLDRLFDSLSQLMSQLVTYRWLAIATDAPPALGLHRHPAAGRRASEEAREALGVADDAVVFAVEDEDAHDEHGGPEPIVCEIPFGDSVLGRLALAPVKEDNVDAQSLCRLVARELGGPLRMAALVDEQQRLAMIDPLTNLMNRRSFLGQINTELSRATRYCLPLSIVLLDIDHFKVINDTRGHAAGDHVLTNIGTLLRRSLRTADMSARWGGEEFVVALTNTDLAGAELVAERIRAEIEGLAIIYQGERVRITGSLGLTEYAAGEEFDAVMDRADRAMYQAKARGRNRVVVWAGMDPPGSEPMLSRRFYARPAASPSTAPVSDSAERVSDAGSSESFNPISAPVASQRPSAIPSAPPATSAQPS